MRARLVGEQGAWKATLAIGLLLWGAAVAAFAATDNVILLPSVILLGSFLVPVVAVEWWWDRRRHSQLSVPFLARTFVVAGTAGLVAAGALETWLVPGRSIEALWIGVIEEAIKLLLVVGAALHLKRLEPRDGILLGATVGFGFAAFESAGYALHTAIRDGDFDFSALVRNELLRGLEAPFLHGAWTGAVGGALFVGSVRRPPPDRLKPSWLLAGVFVVAVTLHALWDASSAAALAITVLLEGTSTQAAALDAGVLPDPAEVSPWLYGGLQNAIQIAVAVLGLWVLRRGYKRTLR